MKVLLNRCNNDIEYVQDCLGYIIGFKEDYKDSEGNLYRVYYKAIFEDDELTEMIYNDCMEEVADWLNPTEVTFYAQSDDETIERSLFKKLKTKYMSCGIDLLDIDCSVKVVKQGKQLILNI